MYTYLWWETRGGTNDVILPAIWRPVTTFWREMARHWSVAVIPAGGYGQVFWPVIAIPTMTAGKVVMTGHASDDLSYVHPEDHEIYKKYIFLEGM